MKESKEGEAPRPEPEMPEAPGETTEERQEEERPDRGIRETTIQPERQTTQNIPATSSDKPQGEPQDQPREASGTERRTGFELTSDGENINQIVRRYNDAVEENNTAVKNETANLVYSIAEHLGITPYKRGGWLPNKRGGGFKELSSLKTEISKTIKYIRDAGQLGQFTPFDTSKIKDFITSDPPEPQAVTQGQQTYVSPQPATNKQPTYAQAVTQGQQTYVQQQPATTEQPATATATSGGVVSPGVPETKEPEEEETRVEGGTGTSGTTDMKGIVNRFVKELKELPKGNLRRETLNMKLEKIANERGTTTWSKNKKTWLSVKSRATTISNGSSNAPKWYKEFVKGNYDKTPKDYLAVRQKMKEKGILSKND
jgi:hypothetical protein